MMTVNEVSKLTGVSIRTLQYYDTIGLLKPIEYTESGYRLYDDTSLERLQQILLFKELEFPLKEIKKIIDAPNFDQKLTLEIARVIRLGFLQQNAFHKDDTCVPIRKQFLMMDLILYLNTKAKALVTMGMPMSILKESNIFDRIISVKYDVPNDRLDMFDDYRKEVDRFYDEVLEKNA